MTPPNVFVILVLFALCLGIAGMRGGWFSSRPRRVRYDDVEKQIDADFPSIDWPEARTLVESVVAHARPEDRAMVWRKLLDAARGDIARLRRVTPNTIESLRRIYGLLGEGGGNAPNA
jgi:hypothetical protein